MILVNLRPLIRNVAWLLPLLLPPLPSIGATLLPRVVNGTPTGDYPAAALVTFFQTAGQSTVSGFCSATLIGCHTVLTAGHCVCSDSADNYASCLAGGVADPRTIRVLIPHVGLLAVQAVRLHPEYEFGVRGDLALLSLGEPADGVPPAGLNDQIELASGTKATVVGYGTTRSGFRAVDDTGIKRAGPVTFSDCPPDIPSATNLCWSFLGDGANACAGDSGGGLLLASDGPEILAAVVSGGTSGDCQAPDQSFGTSVAAHLEWIREQVGGELGVACDAAGLVGRDPTRTMFWQTELTSAHRAENWSVDVAPGATELRVTFNGQTRSAGGFNATSNDFDLLVLPPNAAGTNDAACEDLSPHNFGACRIPHPEPGRWTIRLERVQGQGPVQVTATLLSRPHSCPSDCDRNGTVDIAELVRSVSIALGEIDLSACDAADLDGDGQVTIDEVVQAVQVALSGCS